MKIIHNTPSPLAGKTVRIKAEVLKSRNTFGGRAEYHVEDYWDRVSGKSWMDSDGNPAAIDYALRTGACSHHVPTDDEVLYGKVGPFGKLIHVSEVEAMAAMTQPATTQAEK